MKRRILILALVLVFACSAALLVACKDTSLDKAKAALEEQYANYGKFTSGEAYDLAGSIEVDGKTYTITWTANVDSAHVAIAEAANGGYKVTVTKGTAQKDYTLTATIANEKGDTVTATFDCAIPAEQEQPGPGPDVTEKTDLTPVVNALKEKYATNSFSAGSNYTVVDKITVGGVDYAIEWSVAGAGASQVTINGTNVTVVKGSAAAAYQLVAKVKDPADATNTKNAVFNATIPANQPGPGPDVPNDGSAEHPYTPAEAVEIIKAWTGGKTVSDNAVYVKGTVADTTVTESTATSGKYVFDLVGDDENLVIYYARSSAKPVAGQELVIYGYLKIYTKDSESKCEMDVANNIALVVISIDGTATGLVAGTPDTTVTPDDEKGGKNNPYTVAELKALTSATAPDGMIYAQGYVTSVAAHNTSGYNINIADTKGGSTTFYIFRGDLKDDDSLPYVGDKIQAYGYLTVYNSAYQFGFKNNTSTIVSIVARADATIQSAATNEHVTITFDPAAVSGVVNGKNGDIVTFTVECENGWELNGEPAEAVTVTGAKVTYNNGTYYVTLDGNLEVKVSVKVEGSQTVEKGSAENPYTVAEARAIALGLTGIASGTTVYYDKPVYIRGYVVNVAAQNDFYIADTVGYVANPASTTLEFFKGEKDTGVTADIYLNDEVLIYGYIANYSNSYKCELAKDNGDHNLTPLVKEITTADVSIAQETSSDYTIAFTPANGKNGAEVTFVITINVANKVVKTVTVTNGTATLTDAATNTYTVTLNGNMIVTVELKDDGDNTETKTLNLASSTGIGTTANSEVATVTLSGVELSYLNCKQNSGYVMICKSTATIASGYLDGTVNGSIKKITFTTGASASENVDLSIVFKGSDGSAKKTETITKAKKGTDYSYEYTGTDATTFSIAVTNAYNAQITEIIIEYVPAA